MDIKEHFLMTFVALFFLGLILAKPGDAYQTECKANEEKICSEIQDYKINETVHLNE